MKRNTANSNKKRKYSKEKEYTNVSMITKNIYLGNKVIAKDVNALNDLGITGIVNCALELEYITESYDNTFDWLLLPMEDCSLTGNVEDYIEKAVKYIDNSIQNNNKILVHCAAGISRSSSIVIAYLMYKNNITFDQAFSIVSNKRPCCKPNSAFREQLINFDFSSI